MLVRQKPFAACPHSSASSDREAVASQKKRPAEIDQKKFSLGAKYLDHIWMQYGIQSTAITTCYFSKSHHAAPHQH